MLLNKEGGTQGLLDRRYVIDYYSGQRIKSASGGRCGNVQLGFYIFYSELRLLGSFSVTGYSDGELIVARVTNIQMCTCKSHRPVYHKHM